MGQFCSLMLDALYAIAVPYDRPGFCYLAVDRGHPRLQRVSLTLADTEPVNHAAHIMTELAYIVLHRAVSELRRDHFQDLSAKPPTLRHSRVWVPVRRDLL